VEIRKIITVINNSNNNNNNIITRLTTKYYYINMVTKIKGEEGGRKHYKTL